MRFIPEMQAIVDRNFSLAKRIAFHPIPAELRTKAFFSCWTRKEAYVKACGDGLLIPLDQFDVSLDPNSPAFVLRVQGQTGEGRHGQARRRGLGLWRMAVSRFTERLGLELGRLGSSC
jgi:4'-phosphopantetheinyl transferase